MSEQQKKIIPKFKKKLQGFLSDESGKITKEDVLKMGMMAMGIAGISQDVNAWHSNINQCDVLSAASHANWGNPTGTAQPLVSTAQVYRGCTTVTDSMVGTAYVNSSIAPYSKIVNGHANGTASIQGGGFNGLNATITVGNSQHVNVNSHGSHGSHSQW